jgi:hypothetical protein
MWLISGFARQIQHWIDFSEPIFLPWRLVAICAQSE